MAPACSHHFNLDLYKNVKLCQVTLKFSPNRSFKPLDRQRYRDKMQRGLDALARMLADGNFSFPRQQMGLEMELSLVDERMEPSMSNSVVLEKISDPAFTTELGQHAARRTTTVAHRYPADQRPKRCSIRGPAHPA